MNLDIIKCPLCGERHNRFVECDQKIVHALANAAWSVLNHDNDPHDGQAHNISNWNALCERIAGVLQKP